MDNPGAVSIWLGNCNSKELIRKYLEVKYNEQGDEVPSKFMTDFKLDSVYFDQDLLEYTYINSPTSSLTELLKTASYSEIMIRELVEFYGDELSEKYNVAIRIYDFEYEETVEETIFDGRELTYIGSVIYEE